MLQWRLAQLIVSEQQAAHRPQTSAAASWTGCVCAHRGLAAVQCHAVVPCHAHLSVAASALEAQWQALQGGPALCQQDAKEHSLCTCNTHSQCLVLGLGSDPRCIASWSSQSARGWEPACWPLCCPFMHSADASCLISIPPARCQGVWAAHMLGRHAAVRPAGLKTWPDPPIHLMGNECTMMPAAVASMACRGLFLLTL